LKGFEMKGFVGRTVTTVAILATLGVGAPLAAVAATTTPTTTTTVSSSIIVTMKQYRVAERTYLAKLKVINVTFLGAILTAKSNFASALQTATNSTERISARAAMRVAIAEATSARANALSALGNPPVRPDHKATV
jgi:hypothetical protein